MILCSASGLSSKVIVKYNLTHNPHTSSFLYNLPSLSYCVSSSRKHGRHGEDWADTKGTYTVLPCETDHQHACLMQWFSVVEEWPICTSKHLPSVVCLDDTVSTWCLQFLLSPPLPIPRRPLSLSECWESNPGSWAHSAGSLHGATVPTLEILFETLTVALLKAVWAVPGKA